MNLQTKKDYAEAKKLLKELTWKRDNMRGSDSFTQHMKMHVSLLEAVLLAYRRKHNIFEVGDFIVLLHTNYRSDVFALTKSFKEIYDEKGIVYRHATDLEIKAGRRL